MSDERDWPIDPKFLASLRVRLAEYAAYKGVGNRAEDVAQETFVVLWKKYRHVTDTTEVARIAYAICRLKVLEAIRTPRGEALDEELDIADPQRGIEDKLREAERFELLKRAVHALGTRCQQLIKLRLLGRSTKEISSAMDAQPGTIHVWEHRCRKQLIAELQRLTAVASGQAHG